MKKIIGTAAVLAVICAFGSAHADELLITSAKNKGGSATALDVVSDGSTTALQIRLNVGEGQKVDLSNCVSGLPSTHTGVCAYKNGKVTILVHSDKNELLPAGVVSIGSVTMSSKNRVPMTIAEVMAFDRNGNDVGIKSTLDMDSGESRMIK
ncbi:MAG: hypothetical protein OZ919_00485 [Xanthomonadaceae bacterium]|nr:hypothetical protein [Xanthomonadaceae bacterium]